MKGVIIMEHREQVEAGQAPQLRMIARVEHAKKHPPAWGQESRTGMLQVESEAELAKLIKTISKRCFPLR